MPPVSAQPSCEPVIGKPFCCSRISSSLKQIIFLLIGFGVLPGLAVASVNPSGSSAASAVDSIFINLGHDTTLCQGQALTLGVSGTYTSYLWSAGDTTDTLTVYNTGIYSLTVTDSLGVQASDTIRVTFSPRPDRPVIQWVGALSFCEGDSVEFTSSAGPETIWSTGDTATVIYAHTAGPYTATIYSPEGCPSLPAMLNVTVLPVPIPPGILVRGRTRFCLGDSVTLTATGITDPIRWSTGDTTLAITVRTSGAYSVRVTNPVTECRSRPSDTVQVLVDTVPPRPVVTQTPFTNILICGLDGVRYQWYFEGVPLPDTAQSITAPHDGYYFVRVVTLGGCQSELSDSLLVLLVSSKMEIGLPAITLQPNPASSQVHLLGLPSTQAVMHLCDAAGRRVHTQTLNPACPEFSVKTLPAGLYTIHLQSRLTVWTGRLVVGE